MSAAGAAEHVLTAADDEAVIGIAAPPDDVWALVSDITTMPRWSPETYRTEWVGGVSTAAVGARFRGWNRWGWVRWSTTCEVEVCDPGREFTFATRFGSRAGTRWSYRFEDDGAGGTTVTEARTQLHAPLHGRIAYATVLRGHNDTFAAAMAETLGRLKRAAEPPR